MQPNIQRRGLQNSGCSIYKLEMEPWATQNKNNNLRYGWLIDKLETMNYKSINGKVRLKVIYSWFEINYLIFLNKKIWTHELLSVEAYGQLWAEYFWPWNRGPVAEVVSLMSAGLISWEVLLLQVFDFLHRIFLVINIFVCVGW